MPMASIRPYWSPRVPPSASPPTKRMPLSNPSNSTVLTEFMKSPVLQIGRTDVSPLCSLYKHRRGGPAFGSRNPPRKHAKCSLAGYVHLDLPRLGHFLLRKGHGQHAVLVVGLHAFRIHRVRQGKRPLKGAIRALHAMPAAFRLLGFELALAAKR